MRVLLLSEAGHEAERAAEDDRGAAGEAGVPHVGDLVHRQVGPPVRPLLPAGPRTGAGLWEVPVCGAVLGGDRQGGGVHSSDMLYL